MNRYAIVAFLVALFTSFACGSSGPIGELESAVSELCGCKDVACAKKAGEKIDALTGKLKEMDKSKVSDGDKEKLKGLAVRMVGCMTKVAGTGDFDTYAAKSKSAEARSLVKKLANGARAYYMDQPSTAGSLTPVAPQFPAPSIGPTPPIGSCCKNADKKCAPNPDDWAAPQWVALAFSLEDPHYYSYTYDISADGKTITASAIGDLDCDGDYSTFSITHTAGAETPGELHTTNELE